MRSYLVCLLMFLLGCIILSGCGGRQLDLDAVDEDSVITNNDRPNVPATGGGPYIDPWVLDEVQSFESNMNVRISFDVFQYTGVPNGVLGRCHYYRNTTPSKQTRWVEINPSTWHWGYPQESIMFHELAHCQLNLDHDSATITATVNGRDMTVPASIMYPTVMTVEVWTALRDYYIAELKVKTGPRLF